jgi:Family of unknown function (DUF5362)
MESNPYSSPAANLFGSTSATSAESVSAGVINQLKRTKPWVRFIGVMMWIAIGFMMLASVLMILGGSAMGAAMEKANPAMPAGFMAGIGALYVLIAFLYIYPTIKIWKYGTSIGKLTQSGSNADLENALDQQRAFWKFVGIMMIIMIVVYIVAFVVMIVAGFSMAAAGGLPK